jgi:hypothetical protein
MLGLMDRQECLSYLLVLCLAVPALAAIDGKVVNQTTGKAQAGATVTLYKLGQAGPEQIESVKSAADGTFHISKDAEGPRLVQAAYQDVTYNRILPPGSPSDNVTVAVYNSAKQQGMARVSQHMLFEPVRAVDGGRNHIFKNDGKITYNDVDGGTLKFFLPPATNGVVQVNATAPQGMPVPQAADKTSTANVYKLAFPIKPGETRIDVSYSVPFTTPGKFEGKVLYKGGPTRLVAPNGVTIKGDDIQALGQEPRTQASIYDVKGDSFKVEIAGSGTLRPGDDSAEDSGGATIEQIPPKLYGNMKWILCWRSVFSRWIHPAYRAHAPEAALAAPEESPDRP